MRLAVMAYVLHMWPALCVALVFAVEVSCTFDAVVVLFTHAVLVPTRFNKGYL